MATYDVQLIDIGGVQDLWSLTRGDPTVSVCLLDGPVDLSQRCFAGARLSSLEVGLSSRQAGARAHGTHIASLIFGNGRDGVLGAAPGCSGLLGTVFRDFDEVTQGTCSSSLLAFALRRAVAAGAHVVNVSAGLLSPEGAVPGELASALALCEAANVLVVAAAGNDGCECTHVPANVPSVLAVGALDAAGEPAPFSNWGPGYASHGLLAPGTNVVGAGVDGAARAVSGTSQASAIVSGVAALLISLHLRQTGRTDPLFIRRLILSTARPCSAGAEPGRCLGGRLDVPAALAELRGPTRGRVGMETMRESNEAERPAPAASDLRTGPPFPTPGKFAAAQQAGLSLSGCACTGEASAGCSCHEAPQAPAYVFPIGQIGFDFRNKSNRDSLVVRGTLPNPDDPAAVFRFLSEPDNAHLAEEFVWTLTVDGEPLYAIAPLGAYARDIYEALVGFLGEQEIGTPRPEPRGRRRRAEEDAAADAIEPLDRAEYVAIPGQLVGTATLYMSGKQVDVIAPSLRGLANWNLPALYDAVSAQARALDGAVPEPRREDVLNFLRTMFAELRNEGRAPEDRAKNFVAINFAETLVIFAEQVAKAMALESIQVRPSPVRPAGTDRWDVVLSFFRPTDQLGTAVTEYPITIDVNYVNPTIVRVGPPRQRSMRVIRTL